VLTTLETTLAGIAIITTVIMFSVPITVDTVYREFDVKNQYANKGNYFGLYV
jgi:hypothetical protein